jgi:hypothetical protein
VVLFVRERRSSVVGTAPYLFLGPLRWSSPRQPAHLDHLAPPPTHAAELLRRRLGVGGLAIDLEPLLRGPVFEPLLDDYALFKRLRVDSEAGTTV